MLPGFQEVDALDCHRVDRPMRLVRRGAQADTSPMAWRTARTTCASGSGPIRPRGPSTARRSGFDGGQILAEQFAVVVQGRRPRQGSPAASRRGCGHAHCCGRRRRSPTQKRGWWGLVGSPGVYAGQPAPGCSAAHPVPVGALGRRHAVGRGELALDRAFEFVSAPEAPCLVEQAPRSRSGYAATWASTSAGSSGSRVVLNLGRRWTTEVDDMPTSKPDAVTTRFPTLRPTRVGPDTRDKYYHRRVPGKLGKARRRASWHSISATSPCISGWSGTRSTAEHETGYRRLFDPAFGSREPTLYRLLRNQNRPRKSRRRPAAQRTKRRRPDFPSRRRGGSR